MRYSAMCSAAWEAYEQALNENHYADAGVNAGGEGSERGAALDATTATEGDNYEAEYYGSSEQWPNGGNNHVADGEASIWADHPDTAYEKHDSGWNEEEREGGYGGTGNEDNEDDGIEDDSDDDDDDDDEDEEWVDPQVREAVMFCRHGRKLQLANLLGTGFSPDSRGERGRTLLM